MCILDLFGGRERRNGGVGNLVCVERCLVIELMIVVLMP